MFDRAMENKCLFITKLTIKFYLPPATPVISLPAYNQLIFCASPRQTHPKTKGNELIWMDLRLPKYSANIPDRMDPIGFETAPKLAEKKDIPYKRIDVIVS